MSVHTRVITEVLGRPATAASLLQASMDSCGVERGDRVVVCAASAHVASLAAELAFAKGATFIVLDHRVPEDARVTIVRELGARVVVSDETVPPNLAALPATAHISCSRMVDSVSVAAADGWRELAGRPHEPDGTALIVYTSGSSGRRRGVVLSNGNFEFVLNAIQQRLQYTSRDIIGTFVPLSFDYGLYQVFLARKVGAKLFFGSGAFTGPDLVRQLEEGKVSVFPAVPSLIMALLRLLRRQRHPLRHLRMITSTGDDLPPEWVVELRQHLPHVAVYPMYGLTECKRVSILLPAEFERRPGSVGRALDGTQVLAIDEQGNPLPPGASGQLVVRGPHVARGYFNAPTETAERFKSWGDERVLYTGDHGHVDSEGFIHLMGRNDSLIKHKGMRMSCLEVERAALGVTGVDRCVLLHDKVRDRTKLVACGTGFEIEALRRELSAQLESYKLPDEIEIVADLPNTGNGKVDRQQLAHRFAQTHHADV